MAVTHQTLELVGVGSPIVDLTVQIPESFLKNVRGDKGGMVLVDDAEMAEILARLATQPSVTTGGSAANATFNAARLGVSATFVGKLGNDPLAETYLKKFAAAGVDTSRFKRGLVPNARCLAMVTPDAQRTMRTNLGAAMTLSPSEITEADFRGARHAHIEGYLVFNQALSDAVLESARAAGCTISLDLSSFEVVNASRDWIMTQLGKGIDVVFANEDEIRALFPGDPQDYSMLAKKLAAHGVTAAVKLGADGAWIATGKELHRIEPEKVDTVVDTNGAGDAWAAGFLYGYLRGMPLPRCGTLGNIMGSETVRHVGPLIPDEAWARVKNRVTV
jgi:sugar/nucleoside kinase (ribokinase family)